MEPAPPWPTIQTGKAPHRSRDDHRRVARKGARPVVYGIDPSALGGWLDVAGRRNRHRPLARWPLYRLVRPRSNRQSVTPDWTPQRASCLLLVVAFVAPIFAKSTNGRFPPIPVAHELISVFVKSYQ